MGLRSLCQRVGFYNGNCKNGYSKGSPRQLGNDKKGGSLWQIGESRRNGTMGEDQLSRDLETALQAIPIIDPHSHIDPRRPTARNLDDILGYHYYTELAHSAGMDQGPLSPEVEPRERVRAVLYHMSHFDNTAQYTWFVEILRAFLNFQGNRLSIADATWLS